MGSVVSGLVVARDLDVAVRVGPAFAPTDVVGVLDRLVRLPRVESFTYDDERGARAPGDRLDERYHLLVRVRDDDGALWTLDLSLFLHDAHAHVAAWHERLRDELTVCVPGAADGRLNCQNNTLSWKST